MGSCPTSFVTVPLVLCILNIVPTVDMADMEISLFIWWLMTISTLQWQFSYLNGVPLPFSFQSDYDKSTCCRRHWWLNLFLLTGSTGILVKIFLYFEMFKISWTESSFLGENHLKHHRSFTLLVFWVILMSYQCLMQPEMLQQISVLVLFVQITWSSR